jgi:hypothetical protein
MSQFCESTRAFFKPNLSEERRDMRITTEEVVAGHPALRVRGFLRRYRHGLFMLPAAGSAMQLDPQQAAEFLNDMVTLGLIEHTKPLEVEPTFRVATRGHALANATAA